MSKQLYEKQDNEFKPISPIIGLNDIVDTNSYKTIVRLLNSYNHLYLEYSESKAITRNTVTTILRRKGLWITYIVENNIITECYIGNNTDVQNYIDWTDDSNWKIVNIIDNNK